jgi:hypothetical protein
MFTFGQTPKPFCALNFQWGVAGMADYRAYTVGDDGHFIGVEPLICASDAEATAKAKRLVDGHDVELWSGERLVVRLERKPK